MKKIIFTGLAGLMVLVLFSGSSVGSDPERECSFDKDSMVVVMRFEIKVKPESVAFLKQSFDACKTEVLAKEPGCLDYSMFQSYNDSTIFCITETWATKGDHNAHMQLEHTKKHIAETRDIRDTSFRSGTNYTYWICPGANER
ncbi:MAG: antibiotic biosynthesis monooxygenase [Bacteroidales bacterium]|nr:antibiotic biosynthesis monooxygenase [Bacteroidales bacterium]